MDYAAELAGAVLPLWPWSLEKSVTKHWALPQKIVAILPATPPPLHRQVPEVLGVKPLDCHTFAVFRLRRGSPGGRRGEAGGLFGEIIRLDGHCDDDATVILFSRREGGRGGRSRRRKRRERERERERERTNDFYFIR